MYFTLRYLEHDYLHVSFKHCKTDGPANGPANTVELHSETQLRASLPWYCVIFSTSHSAKLCKSPPKGQSLSCHLCDRPTVRNSQPPNHMSIQGITDFGIAPRVTRPAAGKFIVSMSDHQQTVAQAQLIHGNLSPFCDCRWVLTETVGALTRCGRCLSCQMALIVINANASGTSLEALASNVCFCVG